MCDVSPERGGHSNYEGQHDYREPYRSGYQGDWRNNYWKESEWKDRKDGSGKEGGWSSGMEWVEVPDPRQLTSNRMSSRRRVCKARPANPVRASAGKGALPSDPSLSGFRDRAVRQGLAGPDSSRRQNARKSPCLLKSGSSYSPAPGLHGRVRGSRPSLDR